MNQLQEIINILSSGNEGLTNALIKTKVFLYSTGNKDLVEWVNNEINGYSDKNSVPEYRIVPSRILVDVNNGARRYTSLAIPLHHLSQAEYEDTLIARVKMSISQIEQMTFNAGESGRFEQPIPTDLAYAFYGKSIDLVTKLRNASKRFKSIAFMGY